MTPITNANGKKACRIDLSRKAVEVANKNFKVIVEFLSDDKVEVTCFNPDGSVANKYYLTSTA